MGTSAPTTREHDIPIAPPYKPPEKLPAPDPERWITVEPVRQPAREPAPVRRK